jgi:predicted nuclease of predicted toxin-antitoxin system
VKLKLDENLSRRAANLMRSAGHDAVTVGNQGLSGAADETLFEVCKRES